MSVLVIERVEVGADRVEAVVSVPDRRMMRTSSVPGLPAKAFELLPGFARHRCENDDGAAFRLELADTETPHLFEHVTVELMALAGSPRSLRGETSWDFDTDGLGRFRVRVAYDDDLVALGALGASSDVIDWLYDEGPRPDVDDILARLNAVRHHAPSRRAPVLG